MNLTHREKHILFILSAFMLGAFLFVNILHINMLIFNAWVSAHEPQIILAVGLPLGLYLVFDKERISKE